MSDHESEIVGGEDDDTSKRDSPWGVFARKQLDSTNMQQAVEQVAERERQRQNADIFYEGYLRRNPSLKPEPVQVVTRESIDEIPPDIPIDNTKRKPLKVETDSVQSYQHSLRELIEDLQETRLPLVNPRQALLINHGRKLAFDEVRKILDAGVTIREPKR